MEETAGEPMAFASLVDDLVAPPGGGQIIVPLEFGYNDESNPAWSYLPAIADRLAPLLPR